MDRNTDLYHDNNFYNAESANLCCEYSTEGQVSKELKNCYGLTVMHFNARSLQSNFVRIELCTNQINVTVDIVAVSETWLADGDNGNLHELNGRPSFYIPRKYNKGCGVSLYIGNHLYLKKMHVLSQVAENVIETVFVKV